VHGDIRAGAHGDARSAAASAGASLMPSAHHRHPPAAGLQCRHPRALLLRQHVRFVMREAKALRDRRGRAFRCRREIIVVSMPIRRSSAIAAFAPGRGVSAKAIRPIARTRRRRVAPATRRCGRRARDRRRRPPASRRPLPTALIQARCEQPIRRRPRRANLRLRAAAGDHLVTACRRHGSARSAAAASTASASGCVEPALTAAASASTSPSPNPVLLNTAATRGLPSVSVPVLSKATTETARATSSASASLIRMPCLAATPVPAMMAVAWRAPTRRGRRSPAR